MGGGGVWSVVGPGDRVGIPGVMGLNDPGVVGSGG